MSLKDGSNQNLHNNRTESRDRVAVALAELLDAVPFRDIRVVDLVHASGLSRSTFYRNFETVDDVVTYAYMAYIGEILDLGEPVSMGTEDGMRRIARSIAEVTCRHKTLLSSYHRNGLTSYIIDAGYIRATGLGLEGDRLYLTMINTAIISGWLYTWAENGMEGSVEDIEAELSGLFRGWYDSTGMRRSIL